VEPVDRDRWRSFPDLGELRTAAAGKQAIEKFGPLRVSCDLLAEYSHGSRSIDGSYDRVQVGRIIVSPPWQFPEIIHPRHS